MQFEAKRRKEGSEKEQKALNGDADAAEEAAIDIEPKDEITFDDFHEVFFSSRLVRSFPVKQFQNPRNFSAPR